LSVRVWASAFYSDARGRVVSDLVGLNLGMGAFVVLRGKAESAHAMAGRLYIDD
jgi:hypothetical protein